MVTRTRATLTEVQFQRQVVQLAKTFNWMVYHTRYSIGSVAGFPDLFLLDPARQRVLALELKTDTGKLTLAQQEWLTALNTCGIQAVMVRPMDWDWLVEELR